MKPKNLSEVKSQDEFLVYLIDNYYHILGEEHNSRGVVSSTDSHSYWISVSPDGTTRLDEQCRSDSPCHLFYVIGKCICLVTQFKDYKDMLAKLRNKPSFEDHPDAKCFVQNENGMWCKNIESSDVEPDFGGWVKKAQYGGWVGIQKGQVIGDWKNSFEKAPDKKIPTPNKNQWATSYAILGNLVAIQKENETYKKKYEDLAIEYASLVSRHTLAMDERWTTEDEFEQQIQDLKTENQELKTKIDRIKQSLA